ncbi:MAG: hypothetical protein E6K77_00385 [Candidatus Eisenbacteria bacterium]|uniref:Pilus assembly protein PilP n=1 Tax=Eiseniibacteriota bacterium TaxID=2212470 RepID=A0A538SQH2_UNCEI|nr:MAG: hypothetical protein E6K74_08920 [Candidatus Eisenbacteria bacterium]TMQ67070.1 MAG: hypothetical protein E6K77_00385 [Candidatus Eisenbacteria bacterium]
MNQPSSLALSQSRFFQSRLGILLLALVGLAIAAGIYLMRRQEPTAPISPTPATSPAAQALRRSKPMFGPPAPPWARTDPYGPPAPPEFMARATPAPATPVAGSPDAVTPGAVVVPPNPDAAVSAQAPAPAAVLPGQTPAPAAPIGSALSGEIPKSVDASVLFARERYEYIGGGRRDPFQSLLDGRFLTQSADGSLVDVGDIHLVGIMWGSSDKFALVEDSRGRGFVLRVGDPVVNGYISGISKSELQVVQNAFGESQSLSIRLQTKEGDKNATRN